MAEPSRPPGPKNPLAIGHIGVFRRDPLTFLTRVSREFGDIVWFRLANQSIYFVNHPDLIKDVLVTQQSSFRKSRILQRAKLLLGEGLLTSEGESHLRQRRLVQPAFHRERLAAYYTQMVEQACRTASRWTAGSTFDVHSEMTRLTLAIVGKTLFSADVESEAAEIGQAMTDVLGLFQLSLLPFTELLVKLPIPAAIRFQKAKARLDSTIFRIINERRASGVDAGDLLSMLILAQDEEGGTGGMTDQQVRDEALTLFLAGHETTANALTWAWYLLALNPDAEARFHAELNAVLGSRDPSAEDLAKLTYTAAVFNESLRLYPPAWAIGRMALREVSISGYRIPKGSIVLISPYVMHRDQRYWTSPGEFLPERHAVESVSRRPKFTFLPFGGGARVCIGERFALAEGVLVLATLGQRWRLRLASEGRPQPQAQITLRPRGPIKMFVDNRLDS